MKIRALISAMAFAFVCVSGCQSGLIYGERTSYQLAGIHLNDDPSQPVKIKIGVSRALTSVAPPRGGDDQQQEITIIDANGKETKKVATRGGEAVSVFSHFDLDYLGSRKDVAQVPLLPLTADSLNIRTQFASGQAAIALSENPKRAAQVMGLSVATVGLEKPGEIQLKNKMINCVDELQDRTEIETLAKSLGTPIGLDTPEQTKQGITRKIDSMKEDDLDKTSRIPVIRDCLGRR